MQKEHTNSKELYEVVILCSCFFFCSFYLFRVCFVSPDHYYAVVIVDKRWQHLPKVAEPPLYNPLSLMATHNDYEDALSSTDGSPVEVVFTVKLGSTVLLSVRASEPFDDGVFYFEAISQFKVLHVTCLPTHDLVASLYLPSRYISPYFFQYFVSHPPMPPCRWHYCFSSDNHILPRNNLCVVSCHCHRWLEITPSSSALLCEGRALSCPCCVP